MTSLWHHRWQEDKSHIYWSPRFKPQQQQDKLSANHLHVHHSPSKVSVCRKLQPGGNWKTPLLNNCLKRASLTHTHTHTHTHTGSNGNYLDWLQTSDRLAQSVCVCVCVCVCWGFSAHKALLFSQPLACNSRPCTVALHHIVHHSARSAACSHTRHYWAAFSVIQVTIINS